VDVVHLHLLLIVDALLLQFLTVAAVLLSYLADADPKLLNVAATAASEANSLCLIVCVEIVFHVLVKA